MAYHLIICLAFIFNTALAENLPWNFGIPEDYIVVEKENDGVEAYFIVPKSMDLEKLDDSTKLSEPLIMGIKSQFPGSFNKTMEQTVAEMKKQFANGFDAQFMHWGNYPIVAMKLRLGDDDCYVAYASLEDEDRNGVMFTFAYPTEKEFGSGNKPKEKELAFWNRFLKETKPI